MGRNDNLRYNPAKVLRKPRDVAALILPRLVVRVDLSRRLDVRVHPQAHGKSLAAFESHQGF